VKELTPQELEIIKDKLQGGPRKRMAEFADELNVTYEDLLRNAEQFVRDDGHYWTHENGYQFEGVSLPSTFWDDFELIMQTAVPADKRGHFLSCAC